MNDTDRDESHYFGDGHDHGPVPDAWDECGGCGHDRDDHGTAGRCAAWFTHAGMQQQCWCRAFQEPAA